jgi:hypothetical protein
MRKRTHFALLYGVLVAAMSLGLMGTTAATVIYSLGIALLNAAFAWAVLSTIIFLANKLSGQKSTAASVE